ncbi:MAG TPA: putative sulfate exporter family transporter [Candidatus Aquilonibacter sp.]
MLFGLLAAFAVAVVATVLGSFVPIVGAPVFAIVIGTVIAAVRMPSAKLRPGIAFASRALLQWSIVLLGTNLSLREIAHGGAASLPVMLGTLVIVLALAWLVGRALGLDRDIRRLLGVGTAICGGSAIAALSSVIEAEQADISYALGAVFLFNVVAVLVFPALGHLMHLSQSAFGLWAGTAINDTSSVVAAAFAYGHAAGNSAVIVKLTRTTLIIPIVLFYAWRRIAEHRGKGTRINWRAIIPWFILWFLVAAVLNSLGVIPVALQKPLQELALFAITIALAGVGLGTDIVKIRSAGFRPLLLGAILWAAIALSSLAIARFGHIA